MRFQFIFSISIFIFIVNAQEFAWLPFHPTTTQPPPGRLSITESHRFAGSMAPGGEQNLFRHALGMDDFGNTSMEFALGLNSRLQSSLSWESRRQTAGAGAKFAAFRQSPEGSPLSLAFSLNFETRTQKVEKGKKYSAGGALSLQRSFFDEHWILSASALGQSHTNTDALGAKPAHSIAAGIGVIRQGSSMITFADMLFPLRSGSTGYRYTYGGRASNGIPPLAFGAGFRLWRGTLDLSASNTTSMLASNFLAGADEPTVMRMMEWRLGLGYRHTFTLWKGMNP